MSADASKGGTSVPLPGTLLGDNNSLAAKHPKRLHEFFGWEEPWEHGLAPIEVEDEKRNDKLES